MSILSNSKNIVDVPIDGTFLIYGDGGTGKTVLASSFPKTKEKPMLYVDVLEGGVGSIPSKYQDNLEVIQISSRAEFLELMTELEQVGPRYSTIVIDSFTQLEYMMKKEYLADSGKRKMEIQVWGELKEFEATFLNWFKAFHKRTGTLMVLIAHKQESKDENNPEFNKIIPAMMSDMPYKACTLMSFVWYTAIEKETTVNPKTNEVEETIKFITTIDAHPYLLTKTRRPMEQVIPRKVSNFSYAHFHKIMSNMRAKPVGNPAATSKSTQSPRVIATTGALTPTQSIN